MVAVMLSGLSPPQETKNKNKKEKLFFNIVTAQTERLVLWNKKLKHCYHDHFFKCK
jgi:hypothetical protein